MTYDEPVAQTAATTVVAATATSTATAVAASTISAGSTSAAWVMVNQYQLLLTSPTLETGMPDELMAFMEEFQIFTFNFNFLGGWTFGSIEDLIGNFDFEQKVPGLETIGYESGSIIVNEYNFGKVIFFLIIGNLLLLGLHLLLKKKYEHNETYQKLSKPILNFFMFTLYIRITIEAFFFILINALSEIKTNAGSVEEPFSY